MSEKIVSRMTYTWVYVALLALTGATVLASGLPLGGWHLPVALLIATIKAALVVLIFMHVMYSEKLTWVVATGSLLWLGILIFLTLNDYLFRQWYFGAPP